MSDVRERGPRGWHKSSYSADHEECVEAGYFPPGAEAAVAVRDTKARGAGPVVVFRGDAWSAFVAGVTGTP